VEFVAVLTMLLSGASVAAVIASFLRNSRAERALINRMRDEDQEQILKALETSRRGLKSRSPDPEAVALASALISLAAQGLSENRKKEVLGLLSHGSEKSKANYIVKLIDEAEFERTGLVGPS
jgi:flagellar biosynthesis/type III secretory pathway M-ring protein FliF/YscJ